MTEICRDRCREPQRFGGRKADWLPEGIHPRSSSIETLRSIKEEARQSWVAGAARTGEAAAVVAVRNHSLACAPPSSAALTRPQALPGALLAQVRTCQSPHPFVRGSAPALLIRLPRRWLCLGANAFLRALLLVMGARHSGVLAQVPVAANDPH